MSSRKDVFQFLSNAGQGKLSAQMFRSLQGKERAGKAEHPVGSPEACKGTLKDLVGLSPPALSLSPAFTAHSASPRPMAHSVPREPEPEGFAVSSAPWACLHPIFSDTLTSSLPAALLTLSHTRFLENLLAPLI